MSGVAPGDITTIPEAQWVAPPGVFAITPEVWAATEEVKLTVASDGDGVFLRCVRDTQSVLRLGTPKGPYVVRIRDMRAALLTHLIQAHGWTRETHEVIDG